MTLLPFPEYRPDVSDLNGQHTVTINNVLPRGDGYGPFKALGALTQPLAAGNDSSTKVLLHFDGSDAGTTITDSNSGGSAHTWTAAGNANTDTAQSKWGGTSLACDGTGDWVTTADHADFTLGSGAWTVDFWFRCTATTGSVEQLCGQCNSTPDNSSTSFRIGRNASDVIVAIACVSTTAYTVTGTTTFNDATNTGWHHCAFVRTGDILRLFIDGVQEGGDVAITGTVNDSSSALRVGAAGEVTGDPWTGWIEEFRLSSTARWTDDFTAPQKPYAAASSGVCRGYFRARNTDGTISVFAGTETDLFKLNNTTLDWELVSKSLTAYSAVPSTDHWQFEQFGTSVLAVQANVAPQEYTLGTDSAFGDLSGSPPQARYIAVVGRIVVLTGLTSNPNRVHNSDLDGITTWTAGTGFANTVDLPDGGVVRGVAGGEFGLVFQENALRRLNFIPGAKPAFQIERISDELGLLGPYSVIRASGRIFFYSPKGFYSYSTIEGLRPIGKERVDRTVAAELDTGNLRLLIGAPDPQGTRVFWGYKTLSNSASTFDKLLCFDFGIGENGRWSPADVEGEYLAWFITPGVTLDALDSISGSIDALTFSLDSVSDSVAASLSAATTDHEIGLFDGSNLEAVLETAEQGMGTQRFVVKGFRPITDASDAMGSIKHRSTQQAAAATTTETAINANGMCPARRDTRYARARLRIPSGSTWTFASGVEPDFELTGGR